MRKLYLLLLSFVVGGNSERIKTLRILFLAFTLSSISYSGFALVIVTPANNTTICANTAVTGATPSCTTLGAIAITETLTTDFVTGIDQITLVPPAGWNFCTAPVPVVTHTGSDISATSSTIATGSLVVTFTVTATASSDQITITGLQVQPATPGAAAGSIFASSETGINGVTPGTTDFGDLAVIPAPITGLVLLHSLCTGDTMTLTDPTPGGTWSSSNTTIAIVDPSGDVVGKASGSVTITYTVAGCYATYGPITINTSPPDIINIHDVCAWFPRFYVFDKDSTGAGGTFTSTLATVFASIGTGHAYVEINAPGIASITYTLIGSGCSVTDTFTVWPLPGPILGTDTVCVGSTITMSDAIPGGSWSSPSANISVNSSSGIVTGITAGTATLSYTLPTGCDMDTTIYINPIPAAIAGSPNACLGSTTTLSDATCCGTWSASNTNVSITGGGVVTGLVAGGVATISYTLSTGCYVTLDVTVNPVPAAITASSTEECQGDSTIVLTDPSGGGNWSSSNMAIGTIDNSTGSVYGVSGGVDTISYSFPTGCSSTITVTIDPLPAAITGPDTLCVGQTIVLSDATPSTWLPQAWSSSNTSLAGVTGGPGGFVTADPGTVGGVDTIYYTSSKGCTVMFTITVDPLPSPITGVSVICVGSSTILSDLSPGGVWTSNNPSVGSIDPGTGLLTGLDTGSVIITYTLATGGCDVTFGVTITPVPTIITGPTSVCIGQTITLSDTVGGGTWTSTNTLISTVGYTTGVVTGVSVGVDSIIYSVGAGCTTFIVDTVNDLGPITGGLLCVGDSVQFIDTATGGGVWSSSNTAIATADSLDGFITGIAAGTATISFSLPSGCVATYTATVNPFAQISGSDSVCVGSTTILSDAVPGGIWSSSNTTVATIGPLGDTVTGISSGSVNISYSLPTGCIALFQLGVNPIPDPIIAPLSVCQRDSVTIIDTFGLGIVGLGTWTSGNPAIGTIDPISGLFEGISPGLDTITYTLFAGACSVTDTIRVNPIDTITGIDSMCVGASTTLVDLTPGGIWSSSNTSVATVGTGGTVTGVFAGTAIITYTMPATGCFAIVTVTVDPLPGPITGTDSVCTGATVTLSDASLGGAWSSSLPGVGTIDPVTGIVGGISAGTLTITYTLPTGGCISTVTFTVNKTPPGIMPVPAIVCLSFTVTLSDATPGGLWSNVDSAITIISATTGVDTGLAPGVDSIYYTITTSGCWAGTTVTVFAPPVITITEVPDSVICVGGSATLTATGAGGGGSYSWSPASALSSTSTPITIASPTLTTTYTVVGATINHCKDTTSITVVVDTMLNHLHITGIDTICAGGSTQLIATGNIVSLFAWNPINGLSCTICDTVTASPDVTTTYEATAIDPLGCKDSTAYTVTVLPLPLLKVIGEPNRSPIILCRGIPLQLIASGAWSYVWTPNLFLSCDSCANPVATDTFNMVYELTGYSEFGCADSIPVRVSVLDTNVNTISNDTAICIGTLAQLIATSHSVTGNLDIPSYLWIPSDGLSDPYIFDPLASPGVTTTYTLVVTENACFNDTETVTVSVEPYPTINLSPPSENINAGTPVQVIAEVINTPVKSYIWTPANNTVSCDTCFNPVITPTGLTTYTITVTSIYGCVSYDTITFNPSCSTAGQVFIPNTFTPNGDGVNDRFYVSAIGLKTIVYMKVYNRWGQLLFEADNINPNDPAAGWDGTFKGQVLEPDVFVYEVSAICELGAAFKYTGNVSIVR